MADDYSEMVFCDHSQFIPATMRCGYCGISREELVYGRKHHTVVLGDVAFIHDVNDYIHFDDGTTLRQAIHAWQGSLEQKAIDRLSNRYVWEGSDLVPELLSSRKYESP